MEPSRDGPCAREPRGRATPRPRGQIPTPAGAREPRELRARRFRRGAVAGSKSRRPGPRRSGAIRSGSAPARRVSDGAVLGAELDDGHRLLGLMPGSSRSSMGLARLIRTLLVINAPPVRRWSRAIVALGAELSRLARRDGRKRADDGRVSAPGQVDRGLPRLQARIRLDRWVVRDRDPPGTGQEASRWPGVVATGDRHGRTGVASDAARRNAPGLKGWTRPSGLRSPSGKIITTCPACSSRTASRAAAVRRLDLDGECVEQPDEPPEQGDLEETAPRHVVDTPTDGIVTSGGSA